RLAKLALDSRRFEDAETWFRAAADAAPNDPKVAFEHAMLTLLREDWARGFAQYEARIPTYGLPALGMFPYAMPMWDGPGQAGQQVLLLVERGLGERIFFASALDGMIEDGVPPPRALQPPLPRLFAASFPKARIWSSITHVGSPQQPPQPFL